MRHAEKWAQEILEARQEPVASWSDLASVISEAQTDGAMSAAQAITVLETQLAEEVKVNYVLGFRIDKLERELSAQEGRFEALFNSWKKPEQEEDDDLD